VSADDLMLWIGNINAVFAGDCKYLRRTIWAVGKVGGACGKESERMG